MRQMIVAVLVIVIVAALGGAACGYGGGGGQGRARLPVPALRRGPVVHRPLDRAPGLPCLRARLLPVLRA